jgi:hypothetical protein
VEVIQNRLGLIQGEASSKECVDALTIEDISDEEVS